MDVGEPIIEFSEETRKQVMQRDQYTCFKTGSADGGAMERSRLEVTPICERRFLGDRIDEQNPIRRMTTDFFQRVLGIDKLDVALDGPGNAILLDRYARSIWSSHHWTLKPTQIPNRYKIVDTFGPRKGDGGARNGVYISFADHSVDKHTTEKAHGVELPNRDLILLHAACASIQHRSGAFSFSAPRGWQPWLEGYLGPPNEDATRLAEGRIWGQDDLLPTINLGFQIFLFLVWVLFLLWWQPFDDVYVPLA
ncbi:hypothetical protein OH76DRAFT_1100164 [Lentinus brumalis]|uniref:Uncharacterized protein n=1 Tax=Lentinus brumalis TaxID=2498619 RepID=A0A371CVX7_9APHY|nr:hypothetical protein OH76DRAFT_1100164 [Polyporus brumalis]